MDIVAIRAALATAAEAATLGAGMPPLTAFPYVPDDGVAPFLYVQLEDLTYDKAMRRGQDEASFMLMVWVSAADALSAEQQLDAFLAGSGPSSIKAAIEATRGAPGQLALGGLADDLHVSGIDGAPRWHDWGNGKKYHGVGLRCRVIGTGA